MGMIFCLYLYCIGVFKQIKSSYPKRFCVFFWSLYFFLCNTAIKYCSVLPSTIGCSLPSKLHYRFKWWWLCASVVKWDFGIIVSMILESIYLISSLPGLWFCVDNVSVCWGFILSCRVCIVYIFIGLLCALDPWDMKLAVCNQDTILILVIEHRSNVLGFWVKKASVV